MLHLYGTHEDKIWWKIISLHVEKCSRIKVSDAEGR